MSEDKSINEIISVEEHEGELKLEPAGYPDVHALEFMNPQEVVEYVWQIVCSEFS